MNVHPAQQAFLALVADLAPDDDNRLLADRLSSAFATFLPHLEVTRTVAGETRPITYVVVEDGDDRLDGLEEESVPRDDIAPKVELPGDDPFDPVTVSLIEVGPYFGLRIDIGGYMPYPPIFILPED